VLRVLRKVPCVLRDNFSFCSMAVNIVCSSVATSIARVDPSSRTRHGVQSRYPLVRCLSNPSEVAKCFPQASHTMPTARRALLGAGKFCMKYASTRKEQEIKSRKIKIKKPGGI
jgi:hypothetical protein